MMHSILIAILLVVLPVSAVDTRVGTAASDSPTASIFGSGGEVHGNIIPCVTEPHGHTFWTPQTRQTERKGVSPYYYEDGELLGFRASHWLSGGATQDYGSFAILPAAAPVPLDHAVEIANPSYYAIGGWEMTGRSHSAIFRFADCEYLRITVISDEGEGVLEHPAPGSREISGSNPVHRIYQGSGKPAGFSGHFTVQTDDDFEVVEYVPGESVLVRFLTKGTHIVKAASSFKSIDGARANLQAEIPSWNFDAVKADLEAVWVKRFSLIEVEDMDVEVYQHFYGSLWRASLLPRTVSDAGEPVDYDDFSMWDTYRALHPLLTILEPSRVSDMISALLRKYDRGGWLPIFPCWGSYTSAMIGDHVISMIVDAWTKGIRGFDVSKAYKAMRQNAFESPADSALYIDGRGRRALDSYLKYGYVPLEDEVPYAFHKREQVSRTLEYAYDDWCLSVMAQRLGHFADWVKLRRRAGNWRNVFSPETHYPQGRHADGSFLADDNYLQKTSFITEGTPAHYAWYVPQDIPALIKEMGGEEVFIARLDSMFSEKRYWHGNEPCHQVAWLYDYTSQPWKTQAAVRDILKTEYRNTPGGLSGNDDAGQMSAWYVFAALGFYPVCPGSGEYALGAPSFGKAVLHLENGRSFTIVRSGEGNYVQKVILHGRGLDERVLQKLFGRRSRPVLHEASVGLLTAGRYLANATVGPLAGGRYLSGASVAGLRGGRELRRPFLKHRQIMRGGTLEFVMGPVPAGAQLPPVTFDGFFEDATLRLDYELCGDAKHSEIYLQDMLKTSVWAGRRENLDSLLLRGNGQIVVRSAGTGQKLYANGFSSLFLEWQATPEAEERQRAFEICLQVPFPKEPVTVEVALFDTHGKVAAKIVHEVDPADILIRDLAVGDAGSGSGATARAGEVTSVRAGQTAGIPAQGSPKTGAELRMLNEGGAVDAALDLVVVAEGYLASQKEKFYADAERLICNELFATEPYTSFRDRFNIRALFVPSADEGPSVPREGIWHDTAVDSHYDTFYSDRYLTTSSMRKLYDVIGTLPFEHVIVLVNTPLYGGGGIYNNISVACSDHPSSAIVFVHEFGHAFAGLADEYAYDEFDSVYPADTEPWEPNITTLKDFGSKWEDMLPAGVQIPTAPDPLIDTVDVRKVWADLAPELRAELNEQLGVYEGAGNSTSGVYRPVQECRMRINECDSFCPVCRRAITRTIEFYTR